MHLQLTGQHRPGTTLFHRLDPRTKILATLAFILILSLTPAGAFISYIGFYLLVAAVGIGSGISITWLLRRSFIAIPFALAALTLLFTVPGEPLLTLPQFGGLMVSVEGTVRFASIAIKSWISVQAAVLLVALTPLSELLWGFRALHVPPVFVAIIGFTYRYIFVLTDEAARLMRARKARSGAAAERKAGGSLAWRGKVTGHMAGALFLRTLERSERISQAMAARGYDGEILTLSHPKMQKIDLLGLSVAAVLLAALWALARVNIAGG